MFLFLKDISGHFEALQTSRNSSDEVILKDSSNVFKAAMTVRIKRYKYRDMLADLLLKREPVQYHTYPTNRGGYPLQSFLYGILILKFKSRIDKISPHLKVYIDL